MSWQRMPTSTQLLPVPDDGIVVSNHPPGWLGSRWRLLLDQADKECQDRILRGRNYARRGRLRALDVSPGAATAEVHCEEAWRPTVRVRSFSRQEWAAIIKELTSDLDLIASLLEGELPPSLVERLERRGIRLLPTYDELSFDCDCGDFVMPCTHAATVFHVLTDALDGEPFLLLTLRGRDRDHLLATLRADWGDDAPLAEVAESDEEAPPEGDWHVAPGGVPDLSFHWSDVAPPAAGLRALGPPPGEEHLIGTLLPIYQAAEARVREVLEAVPDREPPKRRVRVEPPPPEPAPDGIDAPAGPASVLAPAADDVPLADRLVDLLALSSGATSASLAAELGTTVSEVRAELVQLQDLGLVYQRKDGRDVLWFLG